MGAGLLGVGVVSALNDIPDPEAETAVDQGGEEFQAGPEGGLGVFRGR